MVIIGIIVAAVLAVVFDKLLSSIIALGVVGSLMTLEFILMHAPDVAIAEASVGAVITPIIFIIALKKVKEGQKNEEVFYLFFTSNCKCSYCNSI